MTSITKDTTESIEKRLIEIPQGVTVTQIGDRHLRIKGPKGTLERKFDRIPTQINITKSHVEIFDYFVNRHRKALVGTLSAHIKNMFLGVQNSFIYKLKIIYSHFPITVQIKKHKGVQVLEYTGMYGQKNRTRIPIPEGVKVKVQEEDIVCEGIDIDSTSQFAARVEQATRLRGKRAKDPRIFQDGIYVYERPDR
ncbi:MAG: 50S ribosomal protein L6 [Candidatus Hodarchaeales archaeon]|jgi:large subunit ribosomal protein L6